MRDPDPTWVQWLAVVMLGAASIYFLVWPGLCAIFTLHYKGRSMEFQKSAPEIEVFGGSALFVGSEMLLLGLAIIGGSAYFVWWFNNDTD